MTLRALEDADLDAARALWNRSAPLDALSPALFQEKLSASRSWLALEDGAPVGLAVGAQWPIPGETRGSVRLLAVAPEARRRSVGTALLERVAADLEDVGATVLRVGECAPNYLTPGVDVRYDAAPAFLEAAGFAPVGESVNLGVDLEAEDWSTLGDERRLIEAGVAVRRAAPGDRTALGRLLDENWPAWHPEVAVAGAGAPPSIHVAVRDGDVLGFAAHSANNAELGWFGPMGTSPAARGLGIGAVLLRRCLADLRVRGLEAATIAWAAALPFYERACGATVTRRFGRWERAV